MGDNTKGKPNTKHLFKMLDPRVQQEQLQCTLLWILQVIELHLRD